MKANGQDVTLKLIKGGNHALSNKAMLAYKIYREWSVEH
jgi:hypothetical protein